MAEEITNEAIVEESPLQEAPLTEPQVESESIETTTPPDDDRAKRLNGIYKLLDGDESYSKYVPKTYDEFINKLGSDGKYARAVHELVAGDDVYSKYLPSTFEETVEYFGLGKPSAVPSKSVGGGSATKGRGVEQQSTLPQKSSEASLDNIQQTMQVYADGTGIFPETLSAADVKELRKQVAGGELPNVSDEKVAKMLAGKSPKQVRIATVNAIPDIKERKTEQARMYKDFAREKSVENQQLVQNISTLNQGMDINIAEHEKLQKQLENPNLDPQTKSILEEAYIQNYDNYKQIRSDREAQDNKLKQNARFIKTMGAGAQSSLKGLIPSTIFNPRSPSDVMAASAWNATAPALLKTLGAVVESYPAIVFGEDTENTKSPIADAIFKIADIATVDVGKSSPQANVSLMDDVNAYNTSQLFGSLLGSVAMTFGGNAVGGALGSQSAAFSQVYGDVYKQGRDAGLTQTESMYFALPTGLVAAYFGDKGVETLAGVFTRTSLRSAIKQGVKELAEKKTPQMMMDFGKKVLLNTLEGAGKEGAQESMEYAVQQESKLFATGGLDAKFEEDLSFEGFKKGLLESFIGGAAGGALLGPFFGAGRNKAFAEVVNKAARDPQAEADFMDQLDASVYDNDITEEQKQQMVEMLEKTKQAAATVPPIVESEPARTEATELVLEQQDLQEQIEQTNPAMAKPLNDRLDEVNNRLGEIAEGKNLPTEPSEEEIKTPAITFEAAIATPENDFFYNGEKGKLLLEGQRIEFETKNRIYDIGNVDEISAKSIDELGVEQLLALDVVINDDNTLNIDGKNYVNNFSNPESAINYDDNGNVVSVNLETENGEKRAFRGQRAEEIAYQYKLKSLEQNGTDEQIDIAIEQAEQAVEAERVADEATPKRKGKSVRQRRKERRLAKEQVAAAAEALAQQSKKLQEVTDKIAELRAEEQAKYAEIDPNDEAKRKEIYEKYNESITPLINQQKELNGEAQEPVAEEVSVEEEKAPTEEFYGYSKENPKIVENREDAIELDEITPNSYYDKISGHVINKATKAGKNWVVSLQVTGEVLFKGSLADAKKYLQSDNMETGIVQIQEKEAAPQAEASVVEALKDVESTAKEVGDLLNVFKQSLGGYAKEDRISVNSKRAETQRTNNATKKLEKLLGFDIGNLPSLTEEQKTIKNNLYNLNKLIGEGRMSKYDSVKELVDDYKKSKSDGTNPELVKSVEQSLPTQATTTSEQAPVVEETNVKKKEVKAPTPSTNKNVRKVSLTLDAGKVALIRRTPIFQQMFSKEQMSNLKEGDNILELNQTAWGKVSRQFGENAKDITNETKAPVVEAKVEVAKESGYSPNDNIFNKPQLKNNKTHGWRTMSESEFNSLSTGEKTYEGGKPKSGNWIAGVPQSAAKFGKKGTVMVEFGGINMMGAENMEEGTTADKSNVTKVWRFNQDTNQFEESSDLLKNVKDGKAIEISNKKETPQEKQDKNRNEIDDIYDNKIPELINKLYEAPVAVGGEVMVSDILELQQKDRKIRTIKEAVDAYFEKLTKYIEEPVTKEELIDDYLTKEQKAIINEIQKLEERSDNLEDEISEIEEAEEAKIKTPKVVAKAPKSSKVMSLEDYDGTTDGEVKLSDTVSIKKEGDSYFVTANDVKGDKTTYRPMTLKEAKVFAENQLLEENKGENINLNDYSTKEIRANELKIGDVYSRTIGGDRYVFELLSNPMQYNGQFYTAKVRVLDVGSFVNKKEIEASGNIKKVSSRVVGEVTIDSFKDLNLDRTGVKFGKVTLINDFNKNETPTEQAQAEPQVTPQVQEVEQYEPITIKEIYHDNFSKENAMYYDEGERELDSGRMSIYVASMTMDITNDDGDSIGALTKLVDDDKNVTWNGEDYEGSPLSDDDFESMNEAKQAIVDRWNKKQKKEFDKQAKKNAREQEKAQAKAEKLKAREEAKAAKKAPKVSTESIFEDLDATNKRGGIKDKVAANKAFAEKYGQNAAVAKAISTNFEAISKELEAKRIFEIKC